MSRAKEAIVQRFLRFVALSVVIWASGCAKPKPTPPAPPVPPHEPVAWLPEDASVVARLDVPAFRNSPLWPVWEAVQRDRLGSESLVDLSKLRTVVFAGHEADDKRASFVAAASGSFGPAHVEAAAVARNVVAEPHGLLTFYRTQQLAFAQVYPDLVLVCSPDRIEALAARATQGATVKLREAPLFRALSERVRWEQAHAALLVEDPRGDAKALAKRRAQRYGFALPLEEVMRAGAALKLGPSIAVTVNAETSAEPQAEALYGSVNDTLSNLQNDIFVGLLGLRPFLRALRVARDQKFVVVTGELPEADFNELLDKLSGLLGVALSGGNPPSQAP